MMNRKTKKRITVDKVPNTGQFRVQTVEVTTITKGPNKGKKIENFMGVRRFNKRIDAETWKRKLKTR